MSRARTSSGRKRGRARAIAWTPEEIGKYRTELAHKLGLYHVPAEQHAAWIAHLEATAAIGGDITATVDLLDERYVTGSAEPPPALPRESTRERSPLPKGRQRNRGRRRAPRRARRVSRRSAVASAGSGADGPPPQPDPDARELDAAVAHVLAAPRLRGVA